MKTQKSSALGVIHDFHPAARAQVYAFAGWVVLWLGGKILPSGLLFNLRDIGFLLFSLATLWIGWVLWQGKEWMITPISWLYLEFLRRISGAKAASAHQRSLKNRASMKTMGSIHLVVGGICAVTTLIYLIFI